MENGNSCFINPKTFEPNTDQWQFLKETERVSIDILEKFISEIETITNLASINLKPKTFEKLKEYLSKQKRISKDQLKIIELVIKNDE